MSHSYCVLLLGIADLAVPRSHFGKAGILVREAGSLTRDLSSLKNPELDAIYLQPSEEARATEELRQILECRPDLPVILISGKPSVNLAREAWHAGAADILFLPLTAESLDESLRHAVRRKVDDVGSKTDEIQARFHYLDDAGKERWVDVMPPKLTIGRSSDNDLIFAKMNVSRAHAEVVVQNGDCYLQDLGSRHGTYVNGIRIERALLKHGDHVRLGGLQGEALTFHKGDLLHSLLAGSEPNAESRFAVRDFGEIGMLLSTFQALSSIPLLDDLLNLVVDTAIELTGAERGFIMLKESDGSLSFRCARNSDKKPLDGSSFRTSRRVPEEAFLTGKRIVINDLGTGDEPEDHASTRKLGVRSISCVPLRYISIHDSVGLSGIASMEIIGVLYVDSVNVGSGLTSSQVEAFDNLASGAAEAIYRARLYKEFREKQKMAEELGIAREIQQALLPPRDKTLPFVTACSLNLPCREVGGDYFDYFDLDGGRLGFALGDVAGKGMPAALLAAMLQGIFCAQTLLNLPLPSMIANVNCSLARRSTGSRFVTFFFGILDAEGTCTYTNAGHNPPILVHPDGSLQELTEGGMVLGLFSQAQYISTEVKLEPGDHLVLFTDGVLEALNLAGEEFGQQRLCDALVRNARASAADMLRSVQDDLTAFSANAPQHDDITMMVLGFREISGI